MIEHLLLMGLWQAEEKSLTRISDGDNSLEIIWAALGEGKDAGEAQVLEGSERGRGGTAGCQHHPCREVAEVAEVTDVAEVTCSLRKHWQVRLDAHFSS